jgi:hypothetical protein
MSELKYLTFPQLVDKCAGNIMIALIKGNFRSGVYDALFLMGQWQQVHPQDDLHRRDNTCSELKSYEDEYLK